ncbi:MAG: extracellular solute-binding protein [Clostridia bacterium]|nr:extracellular solute-binding protein [Clostridia bacterium]
MLIFILQSVVSAGRASKDQKKTAPGTLVLESAYAKYRAEIEKPAVAEGEINIAGLDTASTTGTVSKGENGGLLTEGDSTATWKFTAQSEGFYQLDVSYFPTVSKGGMIERTLLIDGKVPYDQAQYLNFSRVYKDDAVQTNAKGDEVTPEQLEAPRVMTYTLHDAENYVPGNLSVHLTKGEHTVSLRADREKLEVIGLRFYPEITVPTYKDYLAAHPGDSVDCETITVEAEKVTEKSTFTVYPTGDKSSASLSPQHPVKTVLNVISGDKWGQTGQWLSWDIDVKKTGYYKISTRYKQDYYDGGFTSRKLYIDDVCPFEEAQWIRFDYTDTWKNAALGAEEPFRFFLEEGKHTLKLEVVLGDMAPVIARIQDALSALNADYRRILIITGPTPDIYRDYGYDELIPEVLEDFAKQSKELNKTIDALNEMTNSKGDFTNSIGKLTIVLDKMCENPESISELFSTYKDNLSSLGTWIQSIMVQPLDLDQLYISPADEKAPESSDSFFKNLWFKIKRFFLSFFQDYQSFAGDITEDDYKKGNVITVWMSNGREQCQIMQKLTEQYFTPQTGIKVNVQLVTPTALLPSVLAGTGPDVAMNVTSHMPIDFAIRGAAVDLKDMPGFEETTTRFHSAALTPFSFNGATYALPETMTFLMMFYRTDIFEELGLQPPKTWDEFYEVIWKLQQQNLDFGYPINAKTSVVSNMNLYGLELFLYQNGGSLYNDKFTKSQMSQDLNIRCFERMSELFTLYRLPVDYDFANRFRSGEMPIGITEYTMYNQLTIFASEIKGLWAMAPVPGTKQADGSINYTAPAASSGIMMLKSCKQKDKAWEFMKWVTSTETQSRYAIEVESVLGVAAKHATANLGAIEGMSWTDAEYAALKDQSQHLQGTPEIPGGYYTARAIDFAFASVYANGKKPDAAILKQVEMLNSEITRKRAEFGLPTE